MGHKMERWRKRWRCWAGYIAGSVYKGFDLVSLRTEGLSIKK